MAICLSQARGASTCREVGWAGGSLACTAEAETTDGLLGAAPADLLRAADNGVGHSLFFVQGSGSGWALRAPHIMMLMLCCWITRSGVWIGLADLEA